jgi:hypothetical protein
MEARMVRQFSFALLAAAFAATSLAAQAGTSTPAATPNTAASAAGSASAPTANHVTVRGCIERADQVASATAPSGDPDSLQYVLVRPNPEQSSSAKSTPTGTTGASRVLYRLSGDEQKLNPHVGHTVEIVGAPSVMGANSTATTPTASGAQAAMPTGPAPGLTVESVRMLDASCMSK